VTGRRSALLLTAAFLLVAAWSLVAPINEAPDEPAHWQYARFLHDRWTLPHYAPGFDKANSPSLAYALFEPFAVEDASPDMAPTRRIGSADVVAPWSMRDVSLYGDPFVRDAMRHAVPYLITDRAPLVAVLRDRLPALAGEVVHRRVRLGGRDHAAARLSALRAAVRRRPGRRGRGSLRP
jgi:hypothetical protein